MYDRVLTQARLNIVTVEVFVKQCRCAGNFLGNGFDFKTCKFQPDRAGVARCTIEYSPKRGSTLSRLKSLLNNAVVPGISLVMVSTSRPANFSQIGQGLLDVRSSTHPSAAQHCHG